MNRNELKTDFEYGLKMDWIDWKMIEKVQEKVWKWIENT